MLAGGGTVATISLSSGGSCTAEKSPPPLSHDVEADAHSEREGLGLIESLLFAHGMHLPDQLPTSLLTLGPALSEYGRV